MFGKEGSWDVYSDVPPKGGLLIKEPITKAWNLIGQKFSALEEEKKKAFIGVQNYEAEV